MKWVALFSQTGSEIVEVAERLHRWPDLVITNKEDMRDVNASIKTSPLLKIPKNPTIDDYFKVLSKDSIITLNGFLRIIPKEVCEAFEIYNGHPGLITKYKELKGKDPQAKALVLRIPTSGCVIHKVTAEVDAGEVLAEKEISIIGFNKAEIIQALHNTSVELWVKFLRERI